MVVCPCGVLVPAVGATASGAVAKASGKVKKGIRPPACLDPSQTITTQPKDDEKELQDETKYSVESPTEPHPPGGILSHAGTGNDKISKGMSSKLSSESLRLEHVSRASTLALQPSKDSSRYVGTKHLRPNRSPTPTLHHLPAKNPGNNHLPAKDQKSSNNGTPRVRSNSVSGKIGHKHLPAVRTSPTSLASPTTPTSPMDSILYIGAQQGKSKSSSRASSPAGSTLSKSNSKNSVFNAAIQRR